MKQLYFLLFLIASGFLISSCEESDSDFQDLFPKEYYKILYFKNSGSMELELPNLTSSPTFESSFIVCKAGSNPKLKANPRIDIMSQQELDEKYSIPEAVNYKVLPNSTYSFDDQKLKFEEEDLYKTITVSFNPTVIKDLLEGSSSSIVWVLPLKLTSKSDSINAERNTILMKIVSVNTPRIQFKNNFTKINLQNAEAVVNMEAELAGVSNNNWDFNCKVVYAADATEILDSYNQNNPTSKCRLLPADNVNFSLTSFEFVNGNSYASKNLELKISDENLEAGTNYLLPIRLTENSIDGFLMDDIGYILVSKPFGDSNRLLLTAQMLSSPYTEPSEGRLSYLVDGDLGTFWHSIWSYLVVDNLGYYFDVDFNTLNSIQSFSVGYNTRNYNGGMPMTINLYVNGGDYTDWSFVETLTYENNGLPKTAASEYRSSIMVADKKFTKLRFAVTRNLFISGEFGYPGTGKDGNWSLAEFRLWGK